MPTRCCRYSSTGANAIWNVLSSDNTLQLAEGLDVFRGEEFVAVLPDCSLNNAIVVIDRIRTQLHAALTNGTVPPFTVSFGLAASEPGVTFSQTLEAADQALLRAKRTGRDRIVVAGDDPMDHDTVVAPAI